MNVSALSKSHCLKGRAGSADATSAAAPAPAVGQWYWYESADPEMPEKRWLGCIVHIGSNYVRLEGSFGHTVRVHERDFDERCTYEPNHEEYIQARIGEHQQRVDELLGEIKQLTAQLGITRGALGPGSDGGGAEQALVLVRGADNVKKYKQELIRAQKKTLPDLFKKVEKEHEAMATWMKASLIPLEAQSGALKRQTEGIEDRIFIVELYAGLIEQLVQVADGEPAPNGEKVTLFQRRCYMDEECLVDYQAGGMNFEKVKDFDAWLLKPNNLARLLPVPRCAVAFRVRRYDQERELPVTYSDYIRLWEEREADRRTYLYIRNGAQVFRLSTGIDFGENLFPDREHNTLDAGNLWIKRRWSVSEAVVTQAEYEHQCEVRQRAREKYEAALAAYEALSEEEQEKQFAPHWSPFDDSDSYEPLTPESVYYDDAMEVLARDIRQHNRVATVLQGLLDRSPAFSPHPPWQIFTREGFAAGVELVYDQSRAMTVGAPPDFEAYRARLNAGLKRGSLTVGQEEAWLRHEAEKENERERRDWRIKYHHERKWYRPHGNPGPGVVAPIARLGRSGKCTFEWQRERRRYRYYSNEEETPVTCRFACAVDRLLNVDAYQKGDYLQFYLDPRTRADYIKWAPLLLAAEDRVAGVKRRKPDRG